MNSKILLNLDTRNPDARNQDGDKTSAINYETGEKIKASEALQAYTGILLNYQKGSITHLGSLGFFTTYLIELD